MEMKSLTRDFLSFTPNPQHICGQTPSSVSSQPSILEGSKSPCRQRPYALIRVDGVRTSRSIKAIKNLIPIVHCTRETTTTDQLTTTSQAKPVDVSLYQSTPSFTHSLTEQRLDRYLPGATHQHQSLTDDDQERTAWCYFYCRGRRCCVGPNS